jgi:hypothetical protein
MVQRWRKVKNPMLEVAGAENKGDHFGKNFPGLTRGQPGRPEFLGVDATCRRRKQCPRRTHGGGTASHGAANAGANRERPIYFRCASGGVGPPTLKRRDARMSIRA